jgi:hypothetical protein
MTKHTPAKKRGMAVWKYSSFFLWALWARNQVAMALAV